jgi:3-methyladenine DNA glycosylase AlkD
MKNSFHQEILQLIKKKAEKPTQHTFQDAYLGNTHPRYPISMPILRAIAKDWMKEHRALSSRDLAATLNDLIQGESATEKCMAGILLDYATPDQRKFNPASFNKWLDHLEGWAEIDALCTSKYSGTEIPEQWIQWKPLLVKFSRSKNINKRRASLVFFCTPLRNTENKSLSDTALDIVDRLKGEDKILITKAISWVLRSMTKYNRAPVELYIEKNASTLPKIALRETLVKLKTGRKTKKV